MKILSISSLFPPNVIGGAEISAFNLAVKLCEFGHDVHVLTASTSAESNFEYFNDKLKVISRKMPRSYQAFEFLNQPAWKKIFWHAQDMWDPRNISMIQKVLDSINPDVVLVHLIPGLGYNILKEISRRNIPIVYFLHDLGLACVKMSMYRGGRNCEGQCIECKITSFFKSNWLMSNKRVGFCSPSQANLDKLLEYFDVKDFPAVSILNANTYPPATIDRAKSENVRFLYVGRIHKTKGVDFVIKVLSAIVNRFKFSLTILGDGPELDFLKGQYEKCEWIKFEGKVSQAEVSNFMINADCLLIPSLWAENSPGVVIQALGLGLPCIGSNIGGIPELIQNEENGRLLPVGDSNSWSECLIRVLQDPRYLEEWRINAKKYAGRFESNAIARRLEDFIAKVVNIT